MADDDVDTGRAPVLAAGATTSHLLAAQAGDEDAFAVLYRHVQPALLRYLGVLVGGDAEDVAAETWAQACRDLGRFQGPVEGFRAWMTAIARHRALDHLRASRRRPASPMSVEELPEPIPLSDAGDQADEVLGTQWALGMVAELPQDQAEAVMLRTVMGLDAVAAGRVLGKRPGAVRMATHRGLRTLAARLDDVDVAAPDAAGHARPAQRPRHPAPPAGVVPGRRTPAAGMASLDTPVGGIRVAGLSGWS